MQTDKCTDWVSSLKQPLSYNLNNTTTPTPGTPSVLSTTRFSSVILHKRPEEPPRGRTRHALIGVCDQVPTLRFPTSPLFTIVAYTRQRGVELQLHQLHMTSWMCHYRREGARKRQKAGKGQGLGGDRHSRAGIREKPDFRRR